MNMQHNILSKNSITFMLIFALTVPQSVHASQVHASEIRVSESYMSELRNPLYQSFDHTNNSSPDSSPKSTESNHSQKAPRLHNQSSHSFKDISYVLYESDGEQQKNQPIPAQQAQAKSTLICPCLAWLFKTGLTICQ